MPVTLIYISSTKATMQQELLCLLLQLQVSAVSVSVKLRWQSFLWKHFLTLKWKLEWFDFVFPFRISRTPLQKREIAWFQIVQCLLPTKQASGRRLILIKDRSLEQRLDNKTSSNFHINNHVFSFIFASCLSFSEIPLYLCARAPPAPFPMDL